MVIHSLALCSLFLVSCAKPNAGPPTKRMPRPFTANAPSDAPPAELVEALRDLDPVWVSRLRLAGITTGAGPAVPVTVRVRRNGGTGPATQDNAAFIPVVLGNRMGNTGPDADRDGLSDEAELAIGTNPNALDTDGDTIPDSFEIFGCGTRAERADSDGDGTRDDAELNLDDPSTYSDNDGDGLRNGQERASFGTNAESIDSDADGFGDDYEFYFWTAMNDASDPDLDADDDGQPDDFEVANGFDPKNGSSHAQDADGDALPDFADPNDDKVFACVPGHGIAVPAASATGPVTPTDTLTN